MEDSIWNEHLGEKELKRQEKYGGMKKNKKNLTKHVINSQRDKEKYGSRKKAEKGKRERTLREEEKTLGN